MEGDLNTFAAKVCDYQIGVKNLRIEGSYTTGQNQFKPFKITGTRARVLIEMLMKMEETD